MTGTLCIVNWNVQFRVAASAHGRAMRDAIAACEPDIVCITEGSPDFLDMPHRIEASADYGYPRVGNRRKVLLFSRQPWEAVDPVGDPDLPPGRYVAGRTMTPIGALTVHGICIPWARAHVTSGRRDRKPWEEHLRYLAGLGRLLRGACAGPAIVVGDYNQRIPRSRAPRNAFEALQAAFPQDYRCATEGRIPEVDAQTIDHLSCTSDLAVASVSGLTNKAPDGRLLSDHFGVHVRLTGGA